MVSANFAGSAVSRQTSGTPASRCSQADLHAVGGVRIDGDAVFRVDGADGRQPVGVRAPAGDEARPRNQRQVESLARGEIAASPSRRRAPADRTRSARNSTPWRCPSTGWRSPADVRARPVAPGAEEFVQHVVLVAGEDQLAHRQAHAARDVAGVDVAEVARGNREGNLLGIGLRRGEISLEVVDHLRRDRAPS